MITALYSGDPDFASNMGLFSQTITPAPLTIDVNNESRLVDQPNPAFTVSYFGFVDGDGPSSLKSPPSLSTNATTSSPAGVYPITVSGASSPNYTVTFIGGTLTVISPPLVTLTSVADKTNKKHQVTEVLVTFSGAVNTAEADSINSYRLATPGEKGSYSAKNAGIVKLKSARYSPATNEAALTPEKSFALTKPVQLLVYGTGKTALFDSYGRPLDGGNNDTAVIRRNGATITAVAGSPTDFRTSIDPAVVDILLEQDDMIGLRHFARAASSRHHLAAR